jgi:nucleoside-diphosphate-sugar epimerase
VGTSNVLIAAKELGTLERIILTSTSEVYGSALRIPIDEDHPLQAQSPYSATKIAADALGLSFSRSFGMPVTIVRPFNAYGPRQSARAVIPTIISQALAGATLKLGTLETTRDFTFVEDTARGFVAVAESDAALGQVVNLGSGTEVSIGGHRYEGRGDRGSSPQGGGGHPASAPREERGVSSARRQLEGTETRWLACRGVA